MTSNKKEAHFSSSVTPAAEVSDWVSTVQHLEYLFIPFHVIGSKGSRQQGQPGESMNTRQEEEEEVILAAWQTMVRTCR